MFNFLCGFLGGIFFIDGLEHLAKEKIMLANLDFLAVGLWIWASCLSRSQKNG